ncbi:MAG: fluoride efflux transporter CrcB [Gloeocapsa sp. DLM2.Bin57]|nr:MAG: fluoride efflux transporter CrcB [Gloeocapsa sp. DLM2.Bin57]
MRPFLAIILGAIPGVLSRYLLFTWLNDPNLGNLYPFGTFFVNVSGCLLMGFISSLMLERWSINEEIRLLLTTGFLGSYTSFSTYELDSVKILLESNWIKEGLYWIGTPLMGIISFSLGTILAKRFD